MKKCRNNSRNLDFPLQEVRIMNSVAISGEFRRTAEKPVCGAVPHTNVTVEFILYQHEKQPRCDVNLSPIPMYSILTENTHHFPI